MVAKAELEAAERSLMVVGHLPHLSRLGGLLTHSDASVDGIDLMPATMVCFSFNGGAWNTRWVIKPETH